MHFHLLNGFQTIQGFRKSQFLEGWHIFLFENLSSHKISYQVQVHIYFIVLQIHVKNSSTPICLWISLWLIQKFNMILWLFGRWHFFPHFLLQWRNYLKTIIHDARCFIIGICNCKRIKFFMNLVWFAFGRTFAIWLLSVKGGTRTKVSFVVGCHLEGVFKERGFNFV